MTFVARERISAFHPIPRFAAVFLNGAYRQYSGHRADLAGWLKPDPKASSGPRQPMLGAAESVYSFWIFASSRQHVEQRLCLCSDRRYRTPSRNQAIPTGEVRLDDGEATSSGHTRPSVSPFWL